MAVTEPPAASSTTENAPITPESTKELEAAWAELTEAAKGSKVIGLRACTRGGRPWTTDPNAVRVIAAALRELPDAGGKPATHLPAEEA